MNNDLISRSSFKDLLRTLSERETGTPRVIIDWIAGCVDQFPAVDAVEVVHGEWVYTHHMSSMACVTGHVRCVVCNRIRPRLIGDILNFCPNCGADMRERKGDDATD